LKFFRNIIESVGIDNALVEFSVEATDTLLDGSIFAFKFTRVEIERNIMECSFVGKRYWRIYIERDRKMSDIAL